MKLFFNKLSNLILIFVLTVAFENITQACEEFTPKGQLIRTETLGKFTDQDGKELNLSLVFKSYDEDGDARADFETVTRIFADKGIEAFPFLYYKGKDVLLNDDPQHPTYTLDREFEYLDVDATGICENIKLIWEKTK